MIYIHLIYFTSQNTKTTSNGNGVRWYLVIEIRRRKLHNFLSLAKSERMDYMQQM